MGIGVRWIRFTERLGEHISRFIDWLPGENPIDKLILPFIALIFLSLVWDVMYVIMAISRYI